MRDERAERAADRDEQQSGRDPARNGELQYHEQRDHGTCH